VLRVAQAAAVLVQRVQQFRQVLMVVKAVQDFRHL
jgi:hypothetical protein